MKTADFLPSSQLDEDVKNLSSWFEENELLINLKPGKTVLLPFCTSQRIVKTSKNFEVKLINSNDQYIEETKSYFVLQFVEAYINTNSSAQNFVV